MLNETLLDVYHQYCHEHALHEDADQQVTVKKLDLLKQKLEKRKKWFSLWPSGLFLTKKPLRGLYIYGGVGRGKTMILDLFYENLQIDRKQRYHFHEFMQMVHRRVRDLSNQKSSHNNVKQSRSAGKRHLHPMHEIAKQIAQESRVICFDEFHFKDITDAMLLKRLFHFLAKEGVVVVATSNCHPEDLYQNGYQRNLILPFLKKIANSLELCPLDGPKDYRLLQGSQEKTPDTKELHHFTGPLKEGKVWLWSRFQEKTNFQPVEQLEILVNGRPWWVPCVAADSAFFSFDQLCGDTVGSQDYLALAKRVNHIYLHSVPKLSDESLDRLKRFITAIDIFYDQNITFYLASQTSIDELYKAGKEVGLFERTKSRLNQMVSISNHSG